MRYEEMEVYKQAFQASLRIHYLIEGNDDFRGDVKQASREVAAIIAQSRNTLNSPDEAKHLMAAAARQVDMLLVWLDFCKELDILDNNAAQSLKREYASIADSLASAHRITSEM